MATKSPTMKSGGNGLGKKSTGFSGNFGKGKGNISKSTPAAKTKC